jgi:hypothetical protein
MPRRRRPREHMQGVRRLSADGPAHPPCPQHKYRLLILARRRLGLWNIIGTTRSLRRARRRTLPSYAIHTGTVIPPCRTTNNYSKIGNVSRSPRDHTGHVSRPCSALSDAFTSPPPVGSLLARSASGVGYSGTCLRVWLAQHLDHLLVCLAHFQSVRQCTCKSSAVSQPRHFQPPLCRWAASADNHQERQKIHWRRR